MPQHCWGPASRLLQSLVALPVQVGISPLCLASGIYALFACQQSLVVCPLSRSAPGLVALPLRLPELTKSFFLSCLREWPFVTAATSNRQRVDSDSAEELQSVHERVKQVCGLTSRS